MVIKLNRIETIGSIYGGLNAPNSVIIVPNVTNYTVIDPGNANNVAWYKVSAPTTAALTIQVSGTPSAVNTMIGLYDSRGILLEVASNSNFPTTSNTSLSRNLSFGTYYFAIGRVSGLTPVAFSGGYRAQAAAAVGTGIRLSVELVLPPSVMALGYEVTL
jgi:hypothetical protein